MNYLQYKNQIYLNDKIENILLKGTVNSLSEKKYVGYYYRHVYGLNQILGSGSDSFLNFIKIPSTATRLTIDIHSAYLKNNHDSITFTSKCATNMSEIAPYYSNGYLIEHKDYTLTIIIPKGYNYVLISNQNNSEISFIR